MSQLKRKILFPTAVYFKDIPNAKELNKYLFKEIKKWRKADPEGEKKTNSGFGWHSKTDMDKRKEYQPLPILIRGRNKKKPLVTNPNLMTTPVDLSLFFYLGGKLEHPKGASMF